MSRSSIAWLAAAALLGACGRDNSAGAARQRRETAEAQQIAAADAQGASNGTDSARVVTADSAAGGYRWHTGPPQLLDFTVTDAGFSGPDSVLNGLVEIRLTNRGTVPHEIRFLALADHSFEEVRTYLVQNGELPPRQGAGGVGPVMPGRTVSVTLQLAPGRYVIASNAVATDGVSWARKGLFRPFLATGRVPPRPRYVPQQPVEAADAIVQTAGRSWRFTTSLTRGGTRSLPIEGRPFRRTEMRGGNVTLGIEYSGGGDHDLVILRANGPGAMRSYVDWHAGGTPQLDIVGGIPALPSLPGTKMYVHLNLAPGSYIVFCPTVRRIQGTDTGDYETGEYDQFVVK